MLLHISQQFVNCTFTKTLTKSVFVKIILFLYLNHCPKYGRIRAQSLGGEWCHKKYLIVKIIHALTLLLTLGVLNSFNIVLWSSRLYFHISLWAYYGRVKIYDWSSNLVKRGVCMGLYSIPWWGYYITQTYMNTNHLIWYPITWLYIKMEYLRLFNNPLELFHATARYQNHYISAWDLSSIHFHTFYKRELMPSYFLSIKLSKTRYLTHLFKRYYESLTWQNIMFD